jgi:hypothetical protein
MKYSTPALNKAELGWDMLLNVGQLISLLSLNVIGNTRANWTFTGQLISLLLLNYSTPL